MTFLLGKLVIYQEFRKTGNIYLIGRVFGTNIVLDSKFVLSTEPIELLVRFWVNGTKLVIFLFLFL